MSSAPQSTMNQNLFEDQDVIMQSSQLGFFPLINYTNFASLPLLCSQPSSLATESTLNLSDQSVETKQRDDFTPYFEGTQILSLQKSSPNHWSWGGLNDCMNMKRNGVDDHRGVSTMKMKKIKGRRKVRDPRFCFKTMSDVDVLDDGYKWRKYGQKVVKNTKHPRSYYRCTQDNCRVKKRVERLAEDPRMVITTYEGRHIHTPNSHEHDDQDNNNNHHSQAQLNNFFW